MSRSPRTRSVRTRALGVTAAVALIAGTLASSTGAAMAAPPNDPAAEASATPAFEAGSYIVLMKDKPAVAYEGGVSGIPATKPAKGEKFAAKSDAVAKYRGHLKNKQDKAIARAGVDATKYRYTDAISGFAADLSVAEATALSKDASVLAVTKDEVYQLDTNKSPEFLGLTGANGVWSQLGGTADTTNGAGAGTVVGIIDSGIWPENPSFSGAGFPAPQGWNGECVRGQAFDPKKLCNNKLIGAKYFVEGFGRKNIAKYEWLSARDADGHGTHTASTAAGNDGVDAVIEGRSFGAISGMAPQANVAAYKVCWDGKDGAGCFGSDSAKAIDTAVADGVDVLNFSISGTSNNYLDAVELGFMYAADAGIFVAASSGNSGPTASTTNHPSPWLTTVAASTHAIYEKTLVTGDGQRFIGSSITEPLPTPTSMVLSDQIAAAGATPTNAALCVAGSLDAAKAAGKLVVCDRGVIGRVEKSDTVAAAGGVGMVLVNTTPSSLDTDLHRIPTIHLQDTARAAVRTYAMTTAPTGAIVDGNEGSTTKVPEVAGFSSRGPSLGGGGDILKPDISAPGVGVLAAFSPRAGGRNFDFLSGTSMSSPHIAGLGALISDAHPKWSPMAVKSAMMTTARDHTSAASNNLFAGGAGFVEPREFLDPGLVYDANQDDWWAFLAGQGVTFSDGTPVSGSPIDASDLNQASIAIGSLAGKQTVTRTVRNVSSQSSTYTAAVTGLEGVTASVTPSTLTLGAGESGTFTVEFTRSTAVFNAYAQGHLTWTDGAHSVRSPLAVRPVAAAVPAEVTVTDGQRTNVDVVSGFSGTMTTQVKGLTAGTVTPQTAQNTGGADFDPADPRNVRQPFTVPAGTTLTRVELRANDPVNDDLDMYIERVSDGVIVASAASGAANEQYTSLTLAPGAYVIHVQAWAVAGGAATTTFGVRTFTVPDTSADNLAVNPASQPVTTGQNVQFGLTPSGLAAGTPYLGWVGFYNAADNSLAARTIVSSG